jgi:hypothetical protein
MTVIRRPACSGAFYGTDRSWGPHGAHEFWPDAWRERDGQCPGWDAGEHLARGLVDTLMLTGQPGDRAEVTPAVLAELQRLITPSAAALQGAPPEPLRMLFGVPLIEALDVPGGYRVVTA